MTEYIVTKLIIASIFLVNPDNAGQKLLSGSPVRYITMEWPEGKEDCESKARHFNGIVADIYKSAQIDPPAASCVQDTRRASAADTFFKKGV